MVARDGPPVPSAESPAADHRPAAGPGWEPPDAGGDAKAHHFGGGTIHVPLIVSNPFLFAGGATSAAPASLVDVVPTLLALAGADAGRAGPEYELYDHQADPAEAHNLLDVRSGRAHTPPAERERRRLHERLGARLEQTGTVVPPLAPG